MRTRIIALLITLTLAVPASYASLFDRTICPPVAGLFLLEKGQLWFNITQEHDKPVKAHRERVANPLDERSHEVLAKRGTVGVEAHRDKKSGDLFIHWGTLTDVKK